MINNAVEIADGCLFCPQCGNDYLHHGVVTVFDRGEDDNVTRVTTVRHTEPDDEAAQEPAPASELVPSCTVANPSSRRHGPAIAFWCENCDGVSELTIAQHKGMTFIEWRENLLNSRAGG